MRSTLNFDPKLLQNNKPNTVRCRCALCDVICYEGPPKDMPKSIRHCGVLQAAHVACNVGFSEGRNETGHILPPGAG